ncbi:Altered inheritance of mitochondria protein 36 mitochondrial [Dissostichus eleginoides]|uniref:Altered inheritance of mitochondria protein 36 mitochondrial n=1 Tax=Dissostichus eleginoides TaxID=100907 RepID=A0AAD9BMG2_DISEL|nr:Altered inheritance of mitochondria protein 36 mitochondrial [Dissostichus eleginoides]
MLWISCMLIGYITCRPIQQEAAAPRFMHWPPPSNYGYWGRGASSDPGSSSHLPGVPVPRSNKAPELPALQEASSSAGPGNYRAPDFYRSPNMAVVKDDYASLRDERYNSPVVREPEVSEPEVAYAGNGYDTSAPENNVGSYYNLKDASWMDGRYNNPQVSEPEVAYAGNGYDSNAQVVSYGSSASTDVGDGLSSEPEPVFSEVAGLEPVFSEVAGLEPVFSEVAGLEPVYSFSSRSRYQRERSQVAQTRYIPGEPVPWPMPLPRRNSNPRESAAANAPTKGVF